MSMEIAQLCKSTNNNQLQQSENISIKFNFCKLIPYLPDSSICPAQVGPAKCQKKMF